MKEIWATWFLESYDWRYIAAIVGMLILMCGGSKAAYDVYKEGEQVIEEMVDRNPRAPIELDMAIATHTNNVSTVYRVDQESSRVLRL